MGAKGLIALAALLAATASPAAAQDDHPRTELMLTVRTYDSFGVASSDLAAAQTAAANVFRETGIAVVWVNCFRGDQAPQCNEPLRASEAMVRIAAAPRATPDDPQPMGFALVPKDQGTKAPPLATVFADRVSSVARSAGTSASVVLGLVMAHELGHVLLHTAAHGKAGLMRPVWCHSELRSARPDDTRFLPAEAATMREAVRTPSSRSALRRTRKAGPTSTASL